MKINILDIQRNIYGWGYDPDLRNRYVLNCPNKGLVVLLYNFLCEEQAEEKHSKSYNTSFADDL